MLTKQDIDLLLDAVNAWEKEAQHIGMSVGMLGLMLSKDHDEAEENFKASMAESGETTRKRSRQAILIKAKLIQMQEELTADQLFSRVLVGNEKEK